MHFCTVCSVSFGKKQNYEKHLRTQRHANRVNNGTGENVCTCGKAFLSRQSLSVHKKKCPGKPNEMIVTYYENQIKKEQEEKEELRKQIEELLLKNSTVNTMQTIETQNNTQNNNITININAFGEENTDYIDGKTILACLDRVYKSVPAIVEMIHFDPEHPENHNIKITNKKLPYASVMDNNSNWKTVNRKDAIESMMFNGYNLLEEKYPENKKYMSERKRTHFEGFQNKFESEDKELLKQVKSDVELAVINNSNK